MTQEVHELLELGWSTELLIAMDPDLTVVTWSMPPLALEANAQSELQCVFKTSLPVNDL